MKDYYAILGVPNTASQAVIRDAYRRLAKRYHPDVNKAPEAETFFKDVNEAYEVLGNPELRIQYDQAPDIGVITESEIEVPITGPYRDPAYRRRKKGQQVVKEESETKRLERLKEEYKYLFIRMCYIGLLCSSIFVADALLPTKSLSQNLSEVTFVYSGRRGGMAYYRVKTDGDYSFKFASEYNLESEQGSIAEVELSPILNMVLKLKTRQMHEFVWTENVYSSFFFFPGILLTASIVGLLFRKNTDLLLNSAVTVFVTLIVCLYEILY